MLSADAGAGTWRQVGPGGGGWLESILVSGHDARRMFVGCDVAGVFVSDDAGRSYRNGTAGLEHFFIETMAEHPTDPDFLLVGTLGGVYRSTDLGKTWQPCRKGFPPVSDHAHSCPIARILALPGRPSAFLAFRGDPRGMGGASINVPSGYVMRGLGIAVSPNGGESWRYVTTNSLPRVKSVSALTAAGGVLYAGISADGSRFGEVWKSGDRGVSWTRLTQADLPLPLVQGVSVRGGQMLVATRELYQDANKRYLGGGVWHSADGGTTWRKVFSEKFCSRTIFLSDGRWAVSMNDNPYHDSYRGKGVAISADSGATWKNLNNDSLLVPNVSCLVENPHLQGELWAGTDGASVFVRRLARVLE